MAIFTAPANFVRVAQACVGKNDVRQFVNGIYFAANGDIVSTNGNMLAKVPHTDATYLQELADVYDDDRHVIVIIEGTILKTADTCRFDTTANTVDCIDRNGVVKKTLPITMVDARFADYSSVLPFDEPAATESVGVNARFLHAVEILADGSRYGGVVVTLRGPNRIVMFEPLDNTSLPKGSAIGIMPMRF